MNMSEETLNASKEEVSLWQIFLVFAKLGAFTIGGGYAMIPLIRDEMIKRDWMTDEELPDIIAMAQSAPGVLHTVASSLPQFRRHPGTSYSTSAHAANHCVQLSQ